MKKILLTSLLSVGALGAYSQGVLNFTDYDYGNLVTHIWSPSTLNPSVQIHGNTSGDTPSASTSYPNSVKLGGSAVNTGANGIYGNGNNFTVQLQALGGATAAVALSSLLPVTQYTATMNTGTASGGAGAWHLAAIANDPGIPGASGSTPTADIATAAWYNGGGTGDSSLSAAQADKNGIWGESTEQADFSLTPPSSITGKPLGFLNDGGGSSFSLQSTPEPSSIALGVMAAGAFIARRRKN
jgi:hypothetical protein